MERHSYHTRHGEIWLWGKPEAFAGTGPLALFLLGAFNVEVRWPDDAAERLTEIAVLSAQLPGNHSPQPDAHSIDAYAAAYAQVLAQLGRPAIIVGNSLGAVTALAIRSPHVRAIVALDPPLRTARLWPLIPAFREKLREAPDDARLAEFLWNVFGVAPETVEDRDYTDLALAVTVPTIVIMGGEPLMPERDAAILPSLLDEPERRRLQGVRLIERWIVNGAGHNIVDGGYSFVLDAVRKLMARTLGAAA